MEFFTGFLKKSAFENLDISGYTPDTHGWMDGGFGDMVGGLLNERNRNAPLTIIEVGSWKGMSCLTIANKVKEMGFTSVNIIAIDTWLGAPEFWTWGLGDPSRGMSLKINNGYPSVFYTFTKNIKYYNHHDIVCPFPISSMQAVDVLKHHKITADLIYVDAAHEYEPVKTDMNAYWCLLNSGGTMIGDDYMDNWPGVKKAVDEFVLVNKNSDIKHSAAGIGGSVLWKISKV